MDAFDQYADDLRQTITDYAGWIGLTYEKLETEGIKIIASNVSVENMDNIPIDYPFKGQTMDVPEVVLKAMCLAAAFMTVAVNNSEEQSLFQFLLAEVAKKIGFIDGVAYGLDYADQSRRESLSQSGAKGALERHKDSAALKRWALSQSRHEKGSAKQISRKLSRMLPDYLMSVSVDPERLIYEAVLAHSKISSSGVGVKQNESLSGGQRNV